HARWVTGCACIATRSYLCCSGHSGGSSLMSQTDTVHAWWSRLRHQGLLLSPVVMVERYPEAPPAVPFHVKDRLRDARTRFAATLGEDCEADQAAVLSFVDALLE